MAAIGSRAKLIEVTPVAKPHREQLGQGVHYSFSASYNPPVHEFKHYDPYDVAYRDLGGGERERV